VAKFNIEQAVAFAAVQELINEWAHDLDIHNGLHVADLVTDDCIYGVGETQVHGRAGVEKNYRDRLTRLSATPQGVPTMRHMISNLCLTFRKADEVSITFSLLFFTSASGSTVSDPAAVADVRMDCRKEADEHWRIAKFDSNQPFRRVPA
jgi:ketosteroid isomerase-like protein